MCCHDALPPPPGAVLVPCHVPLCCPGAPSITPMTTHPESLQLAALQHPWRGGCCCHHKLEGQPLDASSTREGAQALHVAGLLGQGAVGGGQHLLQGFLNV